MQPAGVPVRDADVRELERLRHAGGFVGVASKLGHALTMETRVLALTVVDRESILRALDEPPTDASRNSEAGRTCLGATTLGTHFPMRLLRQWGWETSVFRVATAIALLHALDDAFLNRQPGVPVTQHALAAAIALVVGVGGIILFPRLRAGLRAAIALVFGVLAATNGSMHAIHITKDGPAHSDLTGALAVIAGVVLMALAIWIPWRHRGEGARTMRRRWP